MGAADDRPLPDGWIKQWDSNCASSRCPCLPSSHLRPHQPGGRGGGSLSSSRAELTRWTVYRSAALLRQHQGVAAQVCVEPRRGVRLRSAGLRSSARPATASPLGPGHVEELAAVLGCRAVGSAGVRAGDGCEELCRRCGRRLPRRRRRLRSATAGCAFLSLFYEDERREGEELPRTAR